MDHQVADMVEDKRARRVQSQGLTFVFRATAVAALEGGPRPDVTDVLCCTFEALSQEDQAFDRALDWTIARFTAQLDGTYIRQIRTLQQPTDVTLALQSSFELRDLLVSLSLYMLLTRIPEARNFSLSSLNLRSIFW